jgi:uncharacterized protein
MNNSGMDKNDLIRFTEDFVKEGLKSYDSGHDWWHIERVRRLSAYINGQEELVDPFILEITVLLHESADSKFSGNDSGDAYLRISRFLESNGMSHLSDRVICTIRNSSFSKKDPSGELNDPLLLILQDADRLDAIGAIGVARAFNYGGFRNNQIHTPGEKGNSTIQHFYDKLLLLSSGMHTTTARKIAEERHEFLEKFLAQFYKEWDSVVS